MSVDIMKGSLNNSQSWNAYLYVRNNPLNFIDLFGLAEKEIQCSMVSGEWRCTGQIEVKAPSSKEEDKKGLTF